MGACCAVGLSRAGRKYLDANANSDCSSHGWYPGCNVRTKTYDDGFYSRSQGNSNARGGGSRANASGDASAFGRNPNTYNKNYAHAGPGNASASSSSHSNNRGNRRLAATNADADSNCHAPHCRVGAHTKTGDYHSASYSGARGSDYYGSSGSADAGARAHGPHATTRTEGYVKISHGH